MNTPQDIESFIDALTERLTQAFPTYAVQAYEPTDADLAPRQIWVTDDEMQFPDNIADQWQSVNVVLPIYVTTILDTPTDRAMNRAARQRRIQVVQVIASVIREFSGPLVLNLRGEALVARGGYTAAYVQIDAQLLDMETD